MKSNYNKIRSLFKINQIYRSLNHSQYSVNDIQLIQLKKLKTLIHYAYQSVKYYREIFDYAGIHPDNIVDLEDLNRIPILTKEQIRNQFWDFLPSELPPCRVSRTSGSTGVPICILSDENSRIHNSAAVKRYRRSLGMQSIKTPIITPLKKKTDTHIEAHWTYMQGFHKTYYINPYSEDKQKIISGKSIIKKLNQPAIIGITPAVKALAYQIKDGILPSLSPVSVITVGETLSSQVREVIEDVFSTRICDIYGCNEAGDVAWQCHHSSLYHVNAENCIFEILNKDNKPVDEGEIGEVVITNLNRYTMPFVRYKNGDLARASYEQCSCGRILPVFKEIIGRSGEDFYLPEGKKIQWNILKGAMNHNLIRQFQLIQNPDASMTIKYIPEEISKTNEIEMLLRERFDVLLSNSLSISFEVVSTIPQASSGKSKLVVCNYKP